MTDQDWRTFADESDWHNSDDDQPPNFLMWGAVGCLGLVFWAAVIFTIIHFWGGN